MNLSSLPSLVKLIPHIVSTSMRTPVVLPFVGEGIPVPGGLIKHGQYHPSTAMFGSQTTEVDIAHAYNGTFIRPRHRCYSYQFERFFGFGAGNLGFNTEVTRYLPYVYEGRMP